MKRPTQLIFCFIFSFISLAQTFSQKQILIDAPPEDSLVTFRLDDLDILYGLAGDTVADHPYYTFTWLFGDGTFINGTRDSVVSHVYTLNNKVNYHLGDPNLAAADVVVYAIGNYSGGTRPPRSPIIPPGDPWRSPEVSEGSFNIAQLGTPDATPGAPEDIIDADDFLKLQFSSEVRPQDTMLTILSFNQPGKLPEQPIQGQLFLFFNSEVEVDTKVKSKAKGQFKNASPPVSPPTLSHGQSELTRSFIQFTNVGDSGEGNISGYGAGYNNVAVFSYGGLESDGQDERHLFLEMVHDTSMWELFKDGQKSSLKYMAVMTAIDFSSDVLGNLPNVTVPDTTLNALLTSTTYDDNEFIPIGPNDPPTQVIAMAESTSDIVSAHDPNAVTLYACECPDTSQHKVVGVIDFSNDGGAPTTLVSIELKVPEQLNINSLESIDVIPTPEAPNPPVAPDINFEERTITWTWPALLQPAETAGMGDPSTQGQIVFAMTVKEGENLAAITPMDACIVFDLNSPMCTLPVSGADIITTNTGEVGGDLLECQKCENYSGEPGTTSGIDWWCALLWALGILLLIIVVAIIRRFVS